MDEGNGFGFGVVGGNAKDDETLEVLLTVVGGRAYLPKYFSSMLFLFFFSNVFRYQGEQ